MRTKDSHIFQQKITVLTTSLGKRCFEQPGPGCHWVSLRLAIHISDKCSPYAHASQIIHIMALIHRVCVKPSSINLFFFKVPFIHIIDSNLHKALLSCRYDIIDCAKYAVFRVKTDITILKICIMLTCPCNVDPLTPHFYLVKLGFRGTLFLIFAIKHRLWVLLTCTHNLCFEQK